MKKLTKVMAMLILFALLCSSFVGCGADKDPVDSADDAETTVASKDTEPKETESNESESEETEPEETKPVLADPVDIETTGGAVIVGTVCNDDNGWYLTPEQPINLEFEYFLDEPTSFENLTRINMFDPAIDYIDKIDYLGKTVTIEGSFSFWREDFETVYFLPYTIYFGKNVEESYAAPELRLPDAENRYDPSIPLPEYMESMVENGRYVYNAFMLTKETLERMGNDFAVFYCDFVEAFLNYETECPCPDKEYAEMLHTIIYYEFPLYDYCAETFEFIKHYDAEREVVMIDYKSETKAEHQEKLDTFMEAANEFLATTSPDQSQKELAMNIYHELCTRMTYNHEALGTLDGTASYNAYINKNGVCVTFACTYIQLLTQVGIEATEAGCNYDDIGHSWVLVNIDGSLYFCDPTFELDFNNGTAYAYFGMTYEQTAVGEVGKDGIIIVYRYNPFPAYPGLISETPIQF